MKRFQFVLLGALLAALGACAVVDSIKSGLASFGRMADGFFNGQGEVVDGKQEGEFRYEYEDGSLRARYEYEDDKRHGPAETYFRDGTKESEGRFDHQRRTGRWTYYHPNGRVRSQGSFHEDRECGEWIFWSPRGDRTQRGHYDADGLPSLQWSYWHPGGSIESRGFFLRNERVGLWSFWDRDGNLSQDAHPLPEGYEIVLETWPDGSVKREGFLVHGRPHGTWVTRHPGGEPRVTGTFENGTPHGPWRLYRDGGGLLALGEMELGRPVGSWTQYGPGGEMPWSAAGIGPPPRFAGEWSEASIADGGDLGRVLGTWVAEAASPVPAEVAVAEAEAEAPAPSEEQVAETEADPDVPVLVQPWTPKQISDFDSARVAYLEGGASQAKFSSRYAKRTVRGHDDEPGGGSPEAAASYVGKPLPMTQFRSETGGKIDLNDFRGERIVLVVLRGFDGEFCPYCAAQTDAFAESWVCMRLEELGARVVIVFPGAREDQEAFVRGYNAIARKGGIPSFFRFLYERDSIVASRMDLAPGQKVKPATFLVDEGGIVRFAYIGEFAADRPSIDLVLGELEKLDAAE